VKFYDLSEAAAWSACIVLIPVLVIFLGKKIKCNFYDNFDIKLDNILAFAIHFYRSLMSHKYEVSVSGIRELEILREQIEQDQKLNDNINRPLQRNLNGLNYSTTGTEVV
jgi:calcium release-activated calcium channel protein 1